MTKLKADYQDTIVNGKRKYIRTVNQDSTVSFENASDYIRPEFEVNASILNAINRTVNDVITQEENTEDQDDENNTTLDNMVSGSQIVGKANTSTNATNASNADTADTADSVERADYAESVTTATTATYANSVTSATRADSATTATRATSATTAQSANNDFILINKQDLSFTNRTCTIYDNRITANSIADIYYENPVYEKMITAEVSSIRLTLTADSVPTGSVIATIKIRTV